MFDTRSRLTLESRGCRTLTPVGLDASSAGVLGTPCRSRWREMARLSSARERRMRRARAAGCCLCTFVSRMRPCACETPTRDREKAAAGTASPSGVCLSRVYVVYRVTCLRVCGCVCVCVSLRCVSYGSTVRCSESRTCRHERRCGDRETQGGAASTRTASRVCV